MHGLMNGKNTTSNYDDTLSEFLDMLSSFSRWKSYFERLLANRDKARCLQEVRWDCRKARGSGTGTVPRGISSS